MNLLSRSFESVMYGGTYGTIRTYRLKFNSVKAKFGSFKNSLGKFLKSFGHLRTVSDSLEQFSKFI